MSNDQLTDLSKRLERVEACVPTLQTDIALIKASLEGMKASYDLSKLMVQWIIGPLVLILGALVGIKVAFPTA
jgi:hypothetical protein